MQVIQHTLAAVLAAVTLPLMLELALISLGNVAFWQRTRREAPAPAPSGWPGLLYMVIPAHNEHLLITRTVHSLKASADDETRILVIAHNCSDETAALARAAGAEVLELKEGSGRGKGAALQAGFAHAVAAGAGAVGVMDADSVASAGLVRALRAGLSAYPAVQCKYELESGEGFSASANLQALAFRAMNTVRARGRAALGLSCGIFGNGFAMRSSVLAAVPYQAFSIAEDLEYHIALIKQGLLVTYTGAAEMVGTGASGNAAIAQRSRWEGGRLRVARENVFPLLRQVFGGRWRLLEPTLDLLSLPMALAVFLLVVSLFVPVLTLKLYALAALTLIGLHVLTAVFVSPSPRSALILLVRVPFYILWKVALIPRILARSRRNTAWERSARTAEPASDTRIS